MEPENMEGEKVSGFKGRGELREGDKVSGLGKTVNNQDPLDIYWLAQCLFLTSQYHRASHALRSRKLDKLYGACQYLAARCHYAAKEFQQALDILDVEEPANKKLLNKSEKEDNGTESAKDWGMSPSSISSSICLLRGKIYDAMDNRPLATSSYKEALKLDVYCFEAFDLLTSHHMLTAQEEKDFLESLPFSQQCSEEEEELLHFVFENKLKKYDKPSDLVVPEMVNGLQDNLDVVVSLAERHYYNCDFKICYKLTSICHLPMLYIGLEYGLTNNSKLAERFFSQALSIAPDDPFVIHEVAVVAFQNGDWKTAEKLFLDAMEKIKAIGSEVTVDKWEPLLNNLGHVCRKLKKYERALEYHRQALVLIPQHASTYSAIGYVHSLMGDFESAIDYFHTALGLKRDDTFSVTMLGHCIEMYFGDTDAYIGTEINDKVRSSLNTPALMKMLNTSESSELPAEPRLEETSMAPLETPVSNQDKMMLETPLRLSLTLECSDMYESEMMLDTLSDTST
ncbi:cell division cycle protein 16 homolog [Nematolebias whitei]|uniref:cell division cycle protein 16 homolog n=1 Tax=Nematolebias whitei TaxID=451745 RepID=UPI0018983142|nr:cell division cycle protein 16 homolog [Nematolebias whitei]